MGRVHASGSRDVRLNCVSCDLCPDHCISGPYATLELQNLDTIEPQVQLCTCVRSHSQLRIALILTSITFGPYTNGYIPCCLQSHAIFKFPPSSSAASRRSTHAKANKDVYASQSLSLPVCFDNLMIIDRSGCYCAVVVWRAHAVYVFCPDTSRSSP